MEYVSYPPKKLKNNRTAKSMQKLSILKGDRVGISDQDQSGRWDLASPARQTSINRKIEDMKALKERES